MFSKRGQRKKKVSGKGKHSPTKLKPLKPDDKHPVIDQSEGDAAQDIIEPVPANSIDATADDARMPVSKLISNIDSNEEMEPQSSPTKKRKRSGSKKSEKKRKPNPSYVEEYEPFDDTLILENTTKDQTEKSSTKSTSDENLTDASELSSNAFSFKANVQTNDEGFISRTDATESSEDLETGMYKVPGKGEKY